MALPPNGGGVDLRQQADDQLAQVLQFFAEMSEVPFDPTRGSQAIRMAIRNIPPTHARAGQARMQQAADSIGIQLLIRQLTIREALNYVANEGPLAVYTLSESGILRWFILEQSTRNQGKLKPLSPDDSEEWYDLSDLVRLLGAYDELSKLEWLIAQPAAPMLPGTTQYIDAQEGLTDAGLFTHADDDHGEAPHGQAHGHGGHTAHISPFRRMISFLQFETRDLFLVIVFAIGVGVFSLATPIAVMSVVNSIALVNVGQQLIVMCLVLFLALALAGLLQFLQGVTVEFVQRRLFVRLAEDLAFRLPRIDIAAFDQQHGPELVNRFFAILTVQKAAATLLLDGITIILQIVIGMTLLGYYHNVLIGFDLILICSLIFLFFVLGWGGPRTAIRESIAKFGVAGWLEAIARHPLAFKTDGGAKFALERTDNLTREYLEARASHFRVLMRQFGFALFLQAAANTGLLAIGGYLVINGNLTLGELVAAELVVTMVVATFAKLGKQVEAYFDMYAAVDKVGHLLDLPTERTGGVAPQERVGGLQVIVHDIKFTYEGAHHEALSDVSLEIKAGERVALMGPNGAGKSTLVDVIFGLRQPSSGWVELDGHDMREYDLDLLRQHVAMVDRIEIFEGSVLANVRMGRPDITVADVRNALERVGLLTTIMSLPKGIHTQLWPGGSPLSLGQANRLMLARAIVGRPRLLILDETLDNMDPSLRQKVLPSILGTGINWTMIVITHSDEVAKLCDRVIRLGAKH